MTLKPFRGRCALAVASALLMIGASTSAQAVIPETQKTAARLLTQATFGPTRSDILRAERLGSAGWIDDQLARTGSKHLPLYQTLVQSNSRYSSRYYVWFERAVRGNDQLAQRMAFALSEIFVVSEKSDIDFEGLTAYYDVLVKNAFGNFRTLLQDVATSPAMGRYLSMLGNRKPDAAAGIRADENFARELMQLFTIGLWQLNLDGTQKLDAAGKPIPTYTQKDVENLARIFTGWNWAGLPQFWTYQPNWLQPMQVYPDQHDLNAKTYLGVNYPAGRTAQVELGAVLDQLFNHPNVGPFISRQLIQRFVTSNPTPAYVARIATVFNNNGQGVRGDLKAVLRAMLLDPEATDGYRTAPNSFGKVREPILRLTHLWRAFPVTGVGPNNLLTMDYPDYMFSQGPLASPSVFNFFSPGYSPPGALRAQDYRAPEMQIINESSYTRTDNGIYGFGNWLYLQNPSIHNSQPRIDLSYERTKAGNVASLIEHLNLVLMAGSMDATQAATLTRRLNTYSSQYDSLWDYHRAAEAIYLITASPQYLVQQ